MAIIRIVPGSRELAQAPERDDVVTILLPKFANVQGHVRSACTDSASGARPAACSSPAS